MKKNNTDEQLIGKWTLHYLSPQGERYNGIFAITNERIYFDANFHLKSSGVEDVEGSIDVPLRSVKRAEAFRHWGIFQRFRLVLKNGAVHVFDRGIASTQSIVSKIPLRAS